MSTPHFSLRAVAAELAGTRLPADIGQASGPVSLSFALREYNVPLTAHIEGSLDLSMTVGDGLARIDVSQTVPTFWNWAIETHAALVCRDDQVLRPLRWTTDFVCRVTGGPNEDTRGSSRGWIQEGTLHHDSVDQSSVALPDDLAVTANWLLLAALPRVQAAGTQRLAFTMLEDLVAVRPRQVLERIDPITVPTADGPRVLVGWRQRGTGIVPVHYWTTETGWPLLVCGQRRVLIATALSASATPTGS